MTSDITSGIGEKAELMVSKLFGWVDDIEKPQVKKAATIGMSILILGAGITFFGVMGGGLSVSPISTLSAVWNGHFAQAWNLVSSGIGSGFSNPSFLSMLGFPMAVGVIGLGGGLLFREVVGLVFGKNAGEVATKLLLLAVPIFIGMIGIGLTAYGAHAFPQINNWLYGGLLTTAGGAGAMALILPNIRHLGNSKKMMH